jgi:hypothetical protein
LPGSLASVCGGVPNGANRAKAAPMAPTMYSPKNTQARHGVVHAEMDEHRDGRGV